MTTTNHVHPHPKNPSAAILGTRLGAGDTVARDTMYPSHDGTWRPVVPALAGMRLHHGDNFYVRLAATVAIEAPTEPEIAAVAAGAAYDGLPAATRGALASLGEKIRRGGDEAGAMARAPAWAGYSSSPSAAGCTMDATDLWWVLPLIVAALLKAVGAYDLEKTSHPLGFLDLWFGGSDVPGDDEA